MPVITLSDIDVAKFSGAFEFALAQSGITRDELAAELDVHVSQLSKIKQEPDLLKVFLFAHKLGTLEQRKRQRVSTRQG